jgi:hypothetical protein
MDMHMSDVNTYMLLHVYMLLLRPCVHMPY